MRITSNQFVTVQYQNDITYLFNRDKLSIKSNVGYQLNSVDLTITEILPNGSVISNIAQTSYTANNNVVQTEVNSLCLSAFKRPTLNSTLLIKRFAISVKAYYKNLNNNTSDVTIIGVYFSGIWGILPINAPLNRNYLTNIYVYNGKRLGSPKILKSNPNLSNNEYNLNSIFGGDIPPEPSDFITTDPQIVRKFKNTIDSEIINVTSNVNYTISTPASWITLSRSSGIEGIMVLVISVTENRELLDRTSVVQFISKGNVIKTLAITQNRMDSYLTTNPETIPEFAFGASSKTISVISLGPYDIIKSTSWVTLSKYNGVTGTSDLIINVSENTSIEPRTATVSFYQPEGSSVALKVINVVQAGAPSRGVITTDPSALNDFEYTESSVNVNVTSNIDYTINTRYNDPFVALSRTSGISGTSPLTITISKNFSSIYRTQYVDFKENSILLKTLAIKQKLAPVTFYLTPETLADYESEASSKSVIVSSGSDYTIYTPEKWITLSHLSGGYGELNLEISVIENTTANSRTGYILFRDVQSGNPIKYLYITQVGSLVPDRKKTNYMAIPQRGWWGGVTAENDDSGLRWRSTYFIELVDNETAIAFSRFGNLEMQPPMTKNITELELMYYDVYKRRIGSKIFPTLDEALTQHLMPAETKYINYNVTFSENINTIEDFGNEEILPLYIGNYSSGFYNTFSIDRIPHLANILFYVDDIGPLSENEKRVLNMSIKKLDYDERVLYHNAQLFNYSGIGSIASSFIAIKNHASAMLAKGEITANDVTTLSPIKNAVLQHKAAIKDLTISEMGYEPIWSWPPEENYLMTGSRIAPISEQVYTTDLYKVTVKTNNITAQDIINKILLRWVDSRGENQCYLFCSSSPTYSLESEKDQTYSDMFEIITYGSDYSINAGRSLKKTVGEQIECFANFLNKTQYDYLREVTTSPVVDYYDFERNLWVSVNITANQLQKKSDLTTLNFIVIIPTYQPQEL